MTPIEIALLTLADCIDNLEMQYNYGNTKRITRKALIEQILIGQNSNGYPLDKGLKDE